MIRKIFLLSSLVAASIATDLNEVVKKVLPSTEYESAFQTEINDLIGVKLKSGTIIYIHQPTELLFIGEIMTKTGASLTQIHRDNNGQYQNIAEPSGIETINNVSELLKYSIDFNINNEKNINFLVFTDPECPFCNNVDTLLKERNANIKHYYIPLVDLHPNAREKSIDIISKGKGIDKEDGERLLDEGLKKIKNLNINGTPQIIVFDNITNKTIAVIKGFNKAALENYSK